NAGGSVTPFMQTLANHPTQETQSSLIKSISETMKMNGTAAERRQVASSILSTVSDIQKNATGETQTSMMSSFLSKLNETNTLNARSEFITIYRRREQSVFSA
ncbi:MAG TPA: hypothetical protein PKM25_19900, partial [Candidatus Ozemobacteraceae bacterium]|nr:hypothetical protein [Candidatus Ozemobacteraceae bacterium]